MEDFEFNGGVPLATINDRDFETCTAPFWPRESNSTQRNPVKKRGQTGSNLPERGKAIAVGGSLSGGRKKEKNKSQRNQLKRQKESRSLPKRHGFPKQQGRRNIWERRCMKISASRWGASP